MIHVLVLMPQQMQPEEVLIGETSSATPNGDGQTFVGGVIRGRPTVRAERQSGRAAEPSGMTYRMSLSACRYKLLLGVDARKWNSMGLRRQVSQNAAQLRHKRTVLSELRPAASSGSFAEQPVYLLCAEREEALHCNTMSEDGYLSTCKQIATYRVER